MPQNNIMNRLGTTGPFIAGILVIVIAIIILQNILGFVQVRSTPPGWQIIRPPDEAATIIIENDTVWTGGKDGLIIIDRATGSQISTPGSTPPFGYVRQILRDRDGWIWAAHDRGLARFRNGSWEVISPSPEVPFAKALSLA
ncbi:MAG TPA: hypothetical protein VLL74_01340, partial [Methanoregula sp.]|nr:hypothetical protein [Methanoregula sp.]